MRYAARGRYVTSRVKTHDQRRSTVFYGIQSYAFIVSSSASMSMSKDTSNDESGSPLCCTAFGTTASLVAAAREGGREVVVVASFVVVTFLVVALAVLVSKGGLNRGTVTLFVPWVEAY